MAHKLDKALIRPGRIDKMIFLDNISQRSAELMFLRMYTPDPTHPNPNLDLKEGELQRLALQFSGAIPDNTFTPAQLQGFLLNHRDSPGLAATEMPAWVADEHRKMEEVKAHAKKVSEWKARRKQRKAMEVLAKTMAAANDEAAAGDAGSKATASVESKKPEEVKTEGGTTNGEKKEEGLKDSSEALRPGINGETSGSSAQKESEKVESLVAQETETEVQENGTAVVNGEPPSGHSDPKVDVLVDAREGTEPAEKQIIEPTPQANTTTLPLPKQQEVTA